MLQSARTPEKNAFISASKKETNAVNQKKSPKQNSHRVPSLVILQIINSCMKTEARYSFNEILNAIFDSFL